GNLGPASGAMTLPLVIKTTAPAPVVTGLQLIDDSGLSNSDHVTSVKQPHVQGTAEPNSFVQLFVNGAGNASGQADASGNWTIQVSAPRPDGSPAVTPTEPSAAGNTRRTAAAPTPPRLVNKTAPPAPAVTGLQPADDSGLSNSDHATN